MQGAVFSDVEGTLVRGSLPRMFLATGHQLGIFSPWQRAQIGALRQAEQRVPRLMRPLQLTALLVALHGQPTERVQRWIEATVPQLMQQIKPAMLQHVREHQAANRPLILVSGALHNAVVRFAAELGGQGEGTKVQQRAGRYRARLDGAICQGQAKAARAQAVLQAHGFDPAQCYAYGDTASDIPFLAVFGHPHAVDPDAPLLQAAQRRGWPILRTQSA